jgi:dipeptidyl aminopeptidase/acylaminoacyl peptidase
MRKQMNTIAWPLLIVMLTCVFSLDAMLIQAQDKRSWQIEDSFRAKSINDLQASPGGDQLLFVVSEKNLEENESYSSIWIWKEGDETSVPLTDVEGSASSPRWSPDGDKIAYFKQGENGPGLWTMNSDGSGKRKLTDFERSNAYLQWGGPENSLSWSPDGEQLAFSAAGPKHYENDINPPHLPTGNDVMIIDRLLYKSVYFYSDQRRTHIWTISADGGEPRQISSGDYDYHSFSWSPDGEYIACVSNQTGRDDFNANNDIVLLSSTGDEMTQLTHTSSPEYQVFWSPDGSELAYKGRIRSNRSKESDAELKKIYVMAAEGGEPVHLNESLDRWVNDFQWGPAGDNIYFTAQNEGRVELHSASNEDGSISSIVTDQGQVGDFSVAGDGTIYYAYEDFTHPDEIYRIDSNSSEQEKLTALNKELTEEVEIIDAEHFSYNSFDGLRIDGWIMRPADFQEGKKYPLILNVHGGPHGQYGYDLSDRFQEQAAKGYVVLFLNPRGSTGRGQAFSDKVVGDIGGGDYQDIMNGLDYAIGRFDFIDSERMGITGGSYGGYLTNWITTHTNRFKAAVPVSSISNLITQWSGGSNPLWYESDMKTMPFEDYERAWDVSPLKYVHGASTPTLFINGRWDFITTLNQANSMFMALKKLGVDTQIALYPHEGHGISRQPKHTADYHERAIAWFDKYLK